MFSTSNPTLHATHTPRRRALLVRGKPSRQQIDWIHRLEDEHIRFLSQDFDITVIDDDFDYAQACDTHNPDFVIVESPGTTRPAPPQISNLQARPDIPRIGMSVQDPHDTARVVHIRMMNTMGIERFFSNAGSTAMRQSPELAGRAFLTPLYIDGDLYKDYGQQKDIPVSIFGWGIAPNFYHWREAIVPQIINHFPTLVYPHPGYGQQTDRYRFPVAGEAYAKMLNRSYFSLSDTTCLDYVVRKHLEIPASGSVLITPQTSDIARYGFKDMENCITGSGHELFQKIARVAGDPDLYESIRTQGHNLVHSRFTRDKWHYLRDWFECYRSLRPGETVQQQGAFGPFAAVRGGAEIPAVACPPLEDNAFSRDMNTAWALILKGEDLDEAERLLTTVSSWLLHMTEPFMPLGIIELLRGNGEKAKEYFLKPLHIRFTRESGNTCFDPEEVAWLSMTGVLMGNGELAKSMRDECASMNHRSIRRMEWLFANQGRLDGTPPEGVETRLPGDRWSTHWTGHVDLSNWINLMTRIMLANQ